MNPSLKAGQSSKFWFQNIQLAGTPASTPAISPFHSHLLLSSKSSSYPFPHQVWHISYLRTVPSSEQPSRKSSSSLSLLPREPRAHYWDLLVRSSTYSVYEPASHIFAIISVMSIHLYSDPEQTHWASDTPDNPQGTSFALELRTVPCLSSRSAPGISCHTYSYSNMTSSNPHVGQSQQTNSSPSQANDTYYTH